MQQDPYAAFSRPVGQSDPYAGIAAPVAASPASARQPTEQRPQAVPRPAQPHLAPRPAAPQTPAPVLNDLGITDAEERAALIAQGYTPEQADEFMFDPGMAPAQPAYGVLNSQNITPEEASNPQLLIEQGYQQGPDGHWFRNVAPPAPLAPAAPVEATGYDLARADEAAKSEMLGDLGGASFTDQFTAPINDELAWAAGFGSQGIQNIIARLRGEGSPISALDRARAMRDATKDDQQQFEEERPGEAIAGGVLGGFAFVPARAAALPGLLGRLGQAGGVGFGYGAADGEGVGGRLVSGGIGAGVSMATAGLLEGGGSLIGTGRRAIERARLPAAARPSRPEARVTGALGRALERDNLDPQAVLANMADAPEGRLPFEAGGENLVGLAETMANVPGAARREIIRAVGGRADETNNRVAGRLADNFGAQGNGFQALRQRIATRGAEADAGMAQIADEVVPLDDASVLAFRSRLSSRAVRDAAEEAIAELSPEGSAAANRLFGLGDTVLDNPGAAAITVREAQDISYALNEAASRAFRGGFNSRGEALSTLGRSIRQNARERVGGYDTWLKSFGDASDVIDGQRVGQNVFAKASEKNAMSAAELSERWAKWSVPARDAYRLGVGEAVLDRVRGQGGVTAMRKLLKDNELAARVRIAFDSEDAFIAFMKAADDEVTMANTASQVLGNSASARRLAGQADLQQQGFGMADALDIATDITSPVGLTRQGVKLALKSVPRRDRSIIGDDELNGLLGAALTDETAMTRLLNLMQTEGGIKGRVADQARRFGLLSSPGAVAGGQERARGLLTANP